MAERLRLRCVACGSLREHAAFGIGSRGTLEALPDYELKRGKQTIGGRGKCHWDFGDVSPQEALALLEGLRSAANKVEDELRKAGIDPDEYLAGSY